VQCDTDDMEKMKEIYVYVVAMSVVGREMDGRSSIPYVGGERRSTLFVLSVRIDRYPHSPPIPPLPRKQNE